MEDNDTSTAARVPNGPLELERGALLDGKYVVHRVVRSGGFGTVWCGEHLRTGAAVAVKVAPKREGVSTLVHEARVMMHIEKHKRVPLPKVRGYGTLQSAPEYNYLVMDLLGEHLSHRNVMRAYRETTYGAVLPCGGRTRCDDGGDDVTGEGAGEGGGEARAPDDPVLSMFLADICTQLHQIVEAIHSTGFIYRDVKPSNFLFAKTPGVKGRAAVHVVDFGLVKRDAGRGSGRRALDADPVGTPHYMSIDAHERRQHTRRDDLESLAYLFYYIYHGSVPWADLHDHRELAAAKRAFRAPECLEGLPNVKMYLERVDALDRDGAPNYRALSAILSYVVVF